MSSLKKWFALYIKPRHEFKAQAQLESIGVENYLPTITAIKKWSDRKKKVTEPLFRGYIFIRADEKERLDSLEQQAVVRTVSFNGKPSVVPDYQIDSLKQMLAGSAEVKVFEGIVKGTEIKVVEGPFKGVEGIVYNVSKDESMLAITVELLNRSVVVSLPSESVVKVKDK